MNEKPQNLDKFKPKNKITATEDLLNSAKSYEDKLLLVQYLCNKEIKRAVVIIKKWLKEDKNKKGIIK